MGYLAASQPSMSHFVDGDLRRMPISDRSNAMESRLLGRAMFAPNGKTGFVVSAIGACRHMGCRLRECPERFHENFFPGYVAP
jgi:hypothetical protein